MTVVLLHAFPHDERMWLPQIDALEGHEVVAPRLYGRGPSIEDWAAAILGEVDGPLAAVGASMGGYVALALARLAPERVTGIMLAGSRAAADSAERRAARDELIARLEREGVPEDTPASATAAELADATRALRDRPDATAVIQAFRGPLVVAVGDEDELLPVDEARAIAATAADGRLEVFPGAGHLPSLDQPEEFNGVLLDFVARTELP